MLNIFLLDAVVSCESMFPAPQKHFPAWCCFEVLYVEADGIFFHNVNWIQFSLISFELNSSSSDSIIKET